MPDHRATSRGTTVDRAFAALYPAPPERRAVRPVAGTGAKPDDVGVARIDAYRGEDHWHLVTVGLAAIGPELSLLTLASDHPPEWALALLLGAARTSAAVGRPFHAGARMAPGAPIDGADSGLVALGIRPDPLVGGEPGGTDPPVLQLVGITAGEHALMGRVGTALVLERLATRDPLLRTDPTRA